jgi:hypothetical protein
MDFQPKKLNFEMVLDYIYVNQYHLTPKKKKTKIPPTFLILKYICKFSNSVIGIILS